MCRLLRMIPLAGFMLLLPIATLAEDKDAKLTLKTRGWVGAVAFAPRVDFLASGGADRSIQLWTPDGKRGGKLDGHGDYVCSLAWGNEFVTLASGSYDRTAIIWDVS